MIQRTWSRVSKQRPCSVCHKPDWCSFSSDESVSCCMRVESARKMRNGGWAHASEIAVVEERPSLPPPCDRKLLLDAGAYHAALRKRWDWRDADGLADLLQVDSGALEALQPAYDALQGAWAFPMRDGAGAVCGVRLRAYDAHKWAVRGSREGLFYDPNVAEAGDLVVCEGPTDAVAAMSLGLVAVGRPSCSGGVAHMLDLVKRLRVRQVTIVADNDSPHRRPDGSVWYPGREGAQVMAKALRRMWRIVMPPDKDIRAWLHNGATREQFDALAASAKWRLG